VFLHAEIQLEFYTERERERIYKVLEGRKRKTHGLRLKCTLIYYSIGSSDDIYTEFCLERKCIGQTFSNFHLRDSFGWSVKTLRNGRGKEGRQLLMGEFQSLV